MPPPLTVVDKAVEEAIEHVMRIMTALSPDDRDEALKRLDVAIGVMRGPEH